MQSATSLGFLAPPGVYKEHYRLQFDLFNSKWFWFSSGFASKPMD